MSTYTQEPKRRCQDGIWYDSTLEARWAEHERLHGMDERYHPGTFDLEDGTIYSPDFYLPRCKEWGEAKWSPTGSDRHKLEETCKRTHAPGVLMLPDGRFEICDEAGTWHPQDDCMMVYCKSCGHYSYTWRGDRTSCRCCGQDAGRVILYYGNHERGKVGDAKTYFSRTAYASARGKDYHKPLYVPGCPETDKKEGR